MIKTQTYTINNSLITNELLLTYISQFWSDIFESVKDSNHLYLMCKVHFNDSELGYRSLGHLLKVNYSDKDLFHEYLTERLGVLTDSYITQPISEITFSYLMREGICEESDR